MKLNPSPQILYTLLPDNSNHKLPEIILLNNYFSEMSNHHKELQDKLIIELLDLIEQSVECKLKIERSNNDGHLSMAKTRYCQGTQTVAESKLPTENSVGFNALRTVELAAVDGQEFQLKTNSVNKDSGFVDPIKWFGILVPRSLQMAQQSFIKSLDYVIEAANIQLKLQRNITNLLALRIAGEVE